MTDCVCDYRDGPVTDAEVQLAFIRLKKMLPELRPLAHSLQLSQRFISGSNGCVA